MDPRRLVVRLRPIHQHRSIRRSQHADPVQPDLQRGLTFGQGCLQHRRQPGLVEKRREGHRRPAG